MKSSALSPPLRFAALAASAWLLAAGHAFGETSALVVTQVRGDTSIELAGKRTRLKPGTLAATPAILRTGRDGSFELRQGATTLSVAANTQLRIPAPSNRQGLLEQVLQEKGNVYYDVAGRQATKLRVETKYLVAVIKGTQFNVAAHEDSATVSLFEGRLEIWSPDESDVVDLHAGEIATRGRGDDRIRVLRMDSGETIRARRDQGDAGTPLVGGDDSATRPARDTAAPELAEGNAVPFNPVALRDLGGTENDLRPKLESVVEVSAAGTAAAVAVDLGAAIVEVGADVDLGNGSAGVAADVNVGLGPVNVASDAALGIDLAAGSVAADASAAVDLGIASVGTNADAAVDLGGATVEAGLDAGVALSGLPPVDAAVDVGADLGAGSVDAGVTAGPLDVGLGVDLAQGSIDLDLGTTAPAPEPAAPTVVDELVKPLRGLLGR